MTTEKLTEVIDLMFTTLDQDGSGFLEKTEMHELAMHMHVISEGEDADPQTPLNEERFEAGFAKMDKNGDGKIAKGEVVELFVGEARAEGMLSD